MLANICGNMFELQLWRVILNNQDISIHFALVLFS